MLYATTRSKTDTYTAYRALIEDIAPDGGLFLPFRFPEFSHFEIEKLKEQSVSETVAQILNVFFSARLTAWDVECCIGKSAFKISAMSHRVLLAELWNNPQGEYAYLINALYKKLCGDASGDRATCWANIAIRIAFWFAIYGQLQRLGFQNFDISVTSGDFSVPMSAWYARKMGLPVGTIVCACNENSTPWDFLHRGEYNTGLPVVNTATPELDVNSPVAMEYLIYGTLGFDETSKYVDIVKRKGVYHIRPDMVKQLSNGMYVSVVGKDRVSPVITSVFRSNNCILDPYTAVTYGGLQDYRAKTGESCPTVLLWERNPLLFSATVEKATGLTKTEIENHLDQH